MSLGRRTTNYRGYLTETTFDVARDEFVESALPLAPTIAAPQPEADGPIHRVLGETEARLRVAHANHLGYPYNLVGASPVPPDFGDYLINNLGDPYAGSHYASEVCALEREAVAWLMDLWECDDPRRLLGLGRRQRHRGQPLGALPGARGLPGGPADLQPRGALLDPEGRPHPAASRRRRSTARPTARSTSTLSRRRSKRTAASRLIVALTCGTTVRGAHDDIGGVLARLDAAGIGAERRFVHVDGALNAMVLPFVDDAPAALRPSFRHAIDSISTSGHKMIGTPMPCGVLVARRRHVDRVASAIAYLRSNDTTLMGSRNGHAVLALWARLHGHGADGYRADVRGCLARADRLAAALRAAGVPVLRNPLSLTVVFPEPGESIVRTYQLACHRGEAHAIVMPNVTDALLDRFLADYLGWWRSAPRLGGRPAVGRRRAGARHDRRA